ncbi:hypothetical protein E1176_03235, partial [Fulvivirga sp. RKSG066]
MKKVALFFFTTALVLSVFTGFAQTPVTLDVQVDDHDLIQPTSIGLDLNFTGVAQLDYLKVQNTTQWARVKLAYDEERVDDAEPLDLFDYEYLEVIIKDFGGTVWGEVKFNLQEYRPLVIEPYVFDAEALPDGWLKVSIPIEDFYTREVRYIAFPFAFNTNFGVKQLRFVGPDKSFVWFGEDKFDNAKKENRVGESELVFKDDGIVIDEISVSYGNNDLTQTSMPFQDFDVNVGPGSNEFAVELKDTDGATYNFLYEQDVREITAISTKPTCNGEGDGTIEVNISDETYSYSFLWNDGDTSPERNNLLAGNYHVNITDNLGKQAYLDFQLNEPYKIRPLVERLNCAGDNVKLSVLGGTEDYFYNYDGQSFARPMDQREFRSLWSLKTNISSELINYAYHKNLIYDIKTDVEGNIYFIGSYDDELIIENNYLGKIEGKGSFLIRLLPDKSFGWVYFQPQTQFHQIDVNDDGEVTILSDKLILLNNDGTLKWQLDVDLHKAKMSMGINGHIYLTGYKNDLIKLMHIGLNGNILWQRDIRGGHFRDNYGAYTRAVNDIAVSPNGDVYLTGYYNGKIDFGNVSLTTSQLNDAFLVRYNNLGVSLWAVVPGQGAGNDWGRHVEYHESGIYVASNLTGKSISVGDLELDAGTAGVIIKYDENGQLIRARQFAAIIGLSFLKIQDMTISNHGYPMISGLIENLHLLPGDNPFPDIGYYMILYFDPDFNLIANSSINTDYYEPPVIPIAATSNTSVLRADFTNRIKLIEEGKVFTSTLQTNFIKNHIWVRDGNDCAIREINFKGPRLSPEQPLICRVEPTTNANVITWYNNGQEDEYIVYKETNIKDEFIQIAQVSGSQSSYIDSDATPMKRSHRYRVQARRCGWYSQQSETHKTIHLTANQGYGGEVNLIWNAYEGRDYDRIHIYRGLGADNFQYMTTVPSSVFSYSDTEPSEQTLYYQLRFSSPNCNPDNFQFSTFSESLAQTDYIPSNTAVRYGQLADFNTYPN